MKPNEIADALEMIYLKAAPFCEEDQSCVYHAAIAHLRAAENGAAVVPADSATIAGLEAAVGHLSALVDQQRALLAEVEDVCGRDGHGAPFEDGESDLIDRVRAQLAMIAAAPAANAQPADDGECRSCVDGKCFTGPECVTLGYDAQPTHAQSDSAGDADGYYLASFKRGNKGIVTWWGPNNAGYTPYLNQAGIYRKDQLQAGYHDSEYTVPVPVAFVRQFEQRLVDSGMSVCEQIFWAAENLRAAIAASAAKGEPQ